MEGLKQFPKGSTVKDWCNSIKQYVGKYVAIKTYDDMFEGWFEEAIEDPKDSDDILLKIKIRWGYALVHRMGIKFIFEAVYRDCDYVCSPPEMKENENG